MKNRRKELLILCLCVLGYYYTFEPRFRLEHSALYLLLGQLVKRIESLKFGHIMTEVLIGIVLKGPMALSVWYSISRLQNSIKSKKTRTIWDRIYIGYVVVFFITAVVHACYFS